MVKTSSDLVKLLNKTFAKDDDHKYKGPMGGIIAKYYEKYPEEALTRVFMVICENWKGDFGPPNLGAIIDMVRKHNDTVYHDRAVRLKYEPKSLPESTEDFIGPEAMEHCWRLVGQFMSQKDKTKKFEEFQVEMEKILNGRNSKS